jgi:ToxR activated gene A lipoprotein domain
LIQNNLTAQSGILDATSASGYTSWNASTQTLVDKVVGTPKPDQSGVPVMTLLGYYDPQAAMNGFNDHVNGGKKFPNDNGFIVPALYANWGNYFTPETIRNSKSTLANSKCELAVTDSANAVLRFPLLDTRLSSDKMNQFHVNLPTKNIAYKTAQLLCNTKSLATISIAAPSAVLPAPIIVGKEAGMLADWYLLGEGSALISKDTLGINKDSTDYVSTVLNRESSVIYYIPVDGVNVLESESSSPAVRQWYAEGSYSTLKVMAVNTATGASYPIALRGAATPNANNALGNYRKLQSGVGKEESGMARIYMVAADNPTLPSGSYNISFNMYATGWHKPEFIRAIKVSGAVVK